eukprot:8946595-Ditylum_brightwellii.AAC.1
MKITVVEPESIGINTPDLTDEEVCDDDDNESQWDKETVVFNKLVVTLLNAMKHNLSFFIGDILLRFFTSQENTITARAA